MINQKNKNECQIESQLHLYFFRLFGLRYHTDPKHLGTHRVQRTMSGGREHRAQEMYGLLQQRVRDQGDREEMTPS